METVAKICTTDLQCEVMATHWPQWGSQIGEERFSKQTLGSQETAFQKRSFLGDCVLCSVPYPNHAKSSLKTLS